MRRLITKIPWGIATLVSGLISFDIAIHPLTIGPDRLVHDPAVYRLWNASYMSGDWYTGMAVASGVYTFYAPLVNAWHSLHIPEELWRAMLYLLSLVVLYTAIVRIARHFTRNPLVAPVIALLHAALCTGSRQPFWLYGPFIQVDGGLAPRSIGIALSFVSLFFLLEDKLLLAAAYLGIATLIHVSNSLIVFSLFLSAWILRSLLTTKGGSWLATGKRALQASAIYLVTGGAFAVYIASHGGPDTNFSTQQFIWTWINVRAPYMYLPAVPLLFWGVALAHIASIGLGWRLLRALIPKQAPSLDLLALIGLGTIVYFLFFYVTAFVWPWLPGFQFYSIRVVYLGYFVTYLFIALTVLLYGHDLLLGLSRQTKPRSRHVLGRTTLIAGAIIGALLLQLSPVKAMLTSAAGNLQVSWQQLIADSQPLPLPRNAILHYLATQQLPFMGPPDIQTAGYYLPNIVSYKSFGFTKSGLPEWFSRLNDVSGGQLQREYDRQRAVGRIHNLEIHWGEPYSHLSPDDVIRLAQQYHFTLFLAHTPATYPFKVIAEDADFHLYQVPQR